MTTTADTDIGAIRATIRSYLEGTHQGDVDVVRALFVPEAELFGRVDGRMRVAHLDQFLDTLTASPAPATLGEKPVPGFIEVWLDGDRASARLTNDDLREDFTLVRDGDTWRIATKTFIPLR